MTIRSATHDDLDGLSALHEACFGQGWRAESFGRLLATPGTFALLAAEGFVLARTAGCEAEILSLGVRTQARRAGLGTALVRAAAATALAEGAKTLFLEVGITNAAARALYAGLGFREAGTRKAYYREPGKPAEDALTLKADLPLLHLGKAGELD
jgi:[ribosomal protein S18]-alanine N-acetyltransferase